MAMDDTWHRRPALVSDRISQFLTCDRKFSRARHKLRRDRIAVVTGINQRRHVLSDSDGEFLRHPPDLVEPLRLDQSGISEVLSAQRQRWFSIGSNEPSPCEIALLRPQRPIGAVIEGGREPTKQSPNENDIVLLLLMLRARSNRRKPVVGGA